MNLIQQAEVLKGHDYVSLARLLLSQVPRGVTFLMKGSVGAGKTTFVATVCRQFGLHFAQSPTYAIHNRYENSQISIDHFDLYRLESEDEIQASGFFDLMMNPADYKFIEWSEKIQAADLNLSRPLFEISFEVLVDQSRIVRLYRIS